MTDNQNSQVFHECGPGWASIIKPLIEQADAEGVMVTQIKEKYAGLRFYTLGHSDKLDKMIDKAEDESLRTCEMCGKSGALSTTGHWLKTLCREHQIEFGYKTKV